MGKSITNHTILINALIEKYNLKSYLEIGINNPANNFNKINSRIKCSVDPDKEAKAMFDCTSDEFFDVNHTIFDLIFIDGLHHADQVQRDFENSLRCLTDNGYILIHDVLPENEEGTLVPRQTKQWWGDVYKWAMKIGAYDRIDFKTFNIDNGCMLVWKDMGLYAQKVPELITWETYLECGHKFMNVTDKVEI
jgi:SAM-dependent methyltransferase